jgi:hypothetical protein
MKMVACNAKLHNAAKFEITDFGTDNDTYDDMDDDESAGHGFRFKGDVPCQPAHHAGFDAVDGQ